MVLHLKKLLKETPRQLSGRNRCGDPFHHVGFGTNQRGDPFQYIISNNYHVGYVLQTDVVLPLQQSNKLLLICVYDVGAWFKPTWWLTTWCWFESFFNRHWRPFFYLVNIGSGAFFYQVFNVEPTLKAFFLLVIIKLE